MTVIVLTDIPNNINTLERLHAWTSFALAFVNPTLGVLEAQDRAEKVAQAAIFQAADNTYRLLSRVSQPYSNAYMTDRTVKVWMHATEISNVALPAEFKSN